MQVTGPDSQLVIVAILTPQPGALDAFRDYEARAARILARHGAVIERTIVEQPSAPDKPLREIHIVTFPDSSAFDRYRADPELAALAASRESFIAHTELILGHPGPDYSSASAQGSNF
jgi:uncharacterized protein (DUF1330 family)